MDIQIIGIDCATNNKKVGIARGQMSDGKLTVDLITKPAGGDSVGDTVCDLLSRSPFTILAMDAPLGWPENFGSSIVHHNAGDVIDIDSNQLFRRETDRYIKAKVGKQPLDVGADRIARTAHSALRYLDEIRSLLGHSIPLAWSPSLSERISAIEVYPAATLKQLGIRSSGYKDKGDISERLEIIDALKGHLNFNSGTSELEQDDDLLDSAICVLAGYHFIKRLCYQPVNMDTAIKEGWIWVKSDKHI
jgi:predicted RNase H-like nuclease